MLGDFNEDKDRLYRSPEYLKLLQGTGDHGFSNCQTTAQAIGGQLANKDQTLNVEVVKLQKEDHVFTVIGRGSKHRYQRPKKMEYRGDHR